MSVGGRYRLNRLNHVRMRPDNDVRPPIGKLLRQRTLAVGNFMRVLNAPVHAHNDNVCFLRRFGQLRPDHILLRGVDHICFRSGRRGQAVRGLRVRGKGEGYAVFLIHREISVILLPAVQPAGKTVVRHGFPETKRGSNSLFPLVINVIVREEEAAHSDVVQLAGYIPRRTKARIGRRLQLIGDQCLYVDKVQIIFLIDRRDMLIESGKVVAVLSRRRGALFRLQIDSVVNQIVTGGRYAHCRYYRLRFRLGGNRRLRLGRL